MDIPFQLPEIYKQGIFSVIKSLWPNALESTPVRSHELESWLLHGNDLDGKAYEDLSLNVKHPRILFGSDDMPVFRCDLLFDYNNGYLDRGLRVHQNHIQARMTFPILARADALRAELHTLSINAIRLPVKLPARYR